MSATATAAAARLRWLLPLAATLALAAPADYTASVDAASGAVTAPVRVDRETFTSDVTVTVETHNGGGGAVAPTTNITTCSSGAPTPSDFPRPLVTFTGCRFTGAARLLLGNASAPFASPGLGLAVVVVDTTFEAGGVHVAANSAFTRTMLLLRNVTKAYAGTGVAGMLLLDVAAGTRFDHGSLLLLLDSRATVEAPAAEGGRWDSMVTCVRLAGVVIDGCAAVAYVGNNFTVSAKSHAAVVTHSDGTTWRGGAFLRVDGNNVTAQCGDQRCVGLYFQIPGGQRH
jgi:hypothetical protein